MLRSEERTSGSSERADRKGREAGWRVLGLVGLVLFAIGMFDVLMYLYPPAFDSPEWEFSVVTRMLTSLPLATVGFGALAAWGLVRGGRKSRMALTAVAFLVVALIAALYVLFALNIPVAWPATSGPQGPAIIRSIVRTSVMGLGFGITYLILGITLVRTPSPRTKT